MVLGVWLLSAVIVSQLNGAFEFDDPVRAGERFAVTKDVVFTPATGWNVEEGHRLGADGAVVKSGDVHHRSRRR